MTQAVERPASAGSAGSEGIYIMTAGYGNTDLYECESGEFEVVAYPFSANGPTDIVDVILYPSLNGVGPGIPLIRDPRGSGAFGLRIPLQPGDVPPGSYAFSMVAVNSFGERSPIWPNVPVLGSPSPAPPPNPPGVGRLLYSFVNQPAAHRSSRQSTSSVSQRPRIVLGGYMHTGLSAVDGGLFELLLVVLGDDIAGVDILYDGIPLPLQDLRGIDSNWHVLLDLTGVPISEDIVLEAQAYDNHGNRSDIWPYVTVKTCPP